MPNAPACWAQCEGSTSPSSIAVPRSARFAFRGRSPPMTTIADIRARLRKDLHDEDALNYRWTDGELDRHIQHTVREFSLAVPLEAKTTLATTAGSRDLSISGLTDLVAIEAVEYPTGELPARIRALLRLALDALAAHRQDPRRRRERQRLLDEAAHDRRDLIDRPRALRGRDRRPAPPATPRSNGPASRRTASTSAAATSGASTSSGARSASPNSSARSPATAAATPYAPGASTRPLRRRSDSRRSRDP